MSLTILAALVALIIAALALRWLWRVFIRVTDREIERETQSLRRRGYRIGDEPRRR